MLLEPIPMTKNEIEPVLVEPNVRINAASESQQGLGLEATNQGKTEDLEFLKEVLDAAQRHLAVRNVGLEFAVHAATGQTMVKVVDKGTGDMIREVPPEDLLDLMAKVDEMLGLLFDQKV